MVIEKNFQKYPEDTLNDNVYTNYAVYTVCTMIQLKKTIEQQINHFLMWGRTSEWRGPGFQH